MRQVEKQPKAENDPSRNQAASPLSLSLSVTMASAVPLGWSRRTYWSRAECEHLEQANALVCIQGTQNMNKVSAPG
jgi:hypothetical protein